MDRDAHRRIAEVARQPLDQRRQVYDHGPLFREVSPGHWQSRSTGRRRIVFEPNAREAYERDDRHAYFDGGR